MEYEELKNKLKDINLTIKDFSKLSEISYRTCISWSIKGRKVPNWVNPFINFYLESQEYKKYKESMQTIMSGLNK
jgi:uncharacterized protein (DUF1919 family)